MNNRNVRIFARELDIFIIFTNRVRKKNKFGKNREKSTEKMSVFSLKKKNPLRKLTTSKRAFSGRYRETPVPFVNRFYDRPCYSLLRGGRKSSPENKRYAYNGTGCFISRAKLVLSKSIKFCFGNFLNENLKRIKFYNSFVFSSYFTLFVAPTELTFNVNQWHNRHF